MRNLLVNLIQKHLLVKSDIKPGDLIEHIDDPDFIVESLGIYYNEYLQPFLFFRTQDGFISSRPVKEFKRCSNIERITEGML